MIKKTFTLLLIIACIIPVKAQVEPLLLSKVTNDEKCHHWVDSTFERMSLKEKVGQLFIFTIAPQETKANQDLLRDVVKDYKVGGLLFSGGELATQARLTNQAQKMAEVPLLITFDGEWGLSMRLKGTPIFPRNKTLGHIKDKRLLLEYGEEVARQCRELGVHVNFAPVADVNINPKNPVINTRSFGNDPANVAAKVVAYSMGLESGGVLSVAKHFPGHGDTDVDSHKALPVLPFDSARLDSIELYPFKRYIRAGLGAIMVGHLEVPQLEPEKGLPASLSRNIVSGLLVEKLGFRGLIFTDALAMKGVAAHPYVSLKAIQAGNDMVLTPRQIKSELEAVLQAVKKGEISEEEINSKCRKILIYKYALGLHRPQVIRLSGLEQRINTTEAQDLIHRLKQAADTAIEDESYLLPQSNRIDSIALEGIAEGAYTGCQIVVLRDGRTAYEKSFGTFDGSPDKPVTSESIFDIASLSKTSGTLLAVMNLYERGLFNLSDKLSDHLAFLKGTNKAGITIRELLYHQSGLPSTISFYQKAIDKESYPGRLLKAARSADHTIRIDAQTWAQPKFSFLPGMISETEDDDHALQVSDDMWLNNSFSDSIIAGIIDVPLRDKRYRYSCIGFVLLQKLVEQKSGMPLNEFLMKEFYLPMGLEHTAYRPLHYFSKEEIVPSTIDKFLRKTTIQGFVHDETAAFQGGVSGNAGLFSTAREVALIHQMLLNGGELNGERYLGAETCRLFTTAKSKISRRGLGFDKPDKTNQNNSPCSKSTPASVYGHTGFTGTCAWVDPNKKLVYVFISNRIYPNLYTNKLSKLEIRQRIQEVIYELVK